MTRTSPLHHFCIKTDAAQWGCFSNFILQHWQLFKAAEQPFRLFVVFYFSFLSFTQVDCFFGTAKGTAFTPEAFTLEACLHCSFCMGWLLLLLFSCLLFLADWLLLLLIAVPLQWFIVVFISFICLQGQLVDCFFFLCFSHWMIVLSVFIPAGCGKGHGWTPQGFIVFFFLFVCLFHLFFISRNASNASGSNNDKDDCFWSNNNDALLPHPHILFLKQPWQAASRSNNNVLLPPPHIWLFFIFKAIMRRTVSRSNDNNALLPPPHIWLFVIFEATMRMTASGSNDDNALLLPPHIYFFLKFWNNEKEVVSNDRWQQCFATASSHLIAFYFEQQQGGPLLDATTTILCCHLLMFDCLLFLKQQQGGLLLEATMTMLCHHLITFDYFLILETLKRKW